MKIEKARAILVLGMHRSGTSAMTGVLHALGVPLGSTLTPADPDINAKGYWEHSVISSINERILRAMGFSWLDERELPSGWWKNPVIASLRAELVEAIEREFGSHRLWAVKDPRLCRLLPLWLEILEEIDCDPIFVLTTRDPREVVRSLRKRNGMQAWKGALLWLRYVIDAETCSRGLRRVVIDYDELLREWRERLPLLSQQLAVDWPVRFVDAERTLAEFLDGSLRHEINSPEDAEQGIELALAEKAYRALRRDISHFVGMQPDLSLHVREAVSGHQPGLAHVNECMLRIEELAGLRSVVAAYEQEVERIKKTVSWKITRPMRLLANMFSKG